MLKCERDQLSHLTLSRSSVNALSEPPHLTLIIGASTMETSLLSSLGATGASDAAGQPDRGVNTDKEAFLKLLVAQVSQQDPLSPQDSDQYVQQLTQFSTLEQLMSLNSGVETLALGQMSNNSQEAFRFVRA